MYKDKECKGCLASVQHSFEEVKASMDAFIDTIDIEYRISEELYIQRLSQCSNCSGLYYETTCRYCGCFVQMRAIRSNIGCPHPEGSRWIKNEV